MNCASVHQIPLALVSESIGIILHHSLRHVNTAKVAAPMATETARRDAQFKHPEARLDFEHAGFFD
jgi:hypothetical protein